MTRALTFGPRDRTGSKKMRVRRWKPWHGTSLAVVEAWLSMRITHLASGLVALLLCACASGAELASRSPVATKRNNLVTELLRASSLAEASAEFTFTRATEGWIFIAASFKGIGTATCTLDPA